MKTRLFRVIPARMMNRRRAQTILTAAAFATAGFVLIGLTSAATFTEVTEAESGQISGSAGLATDAAASGGAYVRFGSTAPASDDIYGSGFQMDALGNMQVGGTSSGANNTAVSYFFVADTTSTINNIRVYIVNGPGYGGGNFGTLRVSLQGDSGGSPDGVTIRSLDVPQPEEGLNTYTFPTPPPVTSGTRYHLVFTNIDPNPTVNFVSMDLTYSDRITTPRQPKFSDNEFGAMRKFGTSGSWQMANNEQQYTPILQLNYANGRQQGQGYMEMSYGSGEVGTINGPAKMVRERFTVSGGNREISQAAIRIQRLSGTDPLVVTLEDGTGAAIDSFTVPAANIPQAPNTGNDNFLGQAAVYVSGSFSQKRTIVNGATYSFRLSTASGTTYNCWVIRKGVSYGFSGATYFSDGYSQKTTDGSSWSSLGRVNNQNDLQFYLK